MLDAKREEFVRPFWEFAQTYPHTPNGQNHLIFYKSGREQGRRNFEEIAAAAVRGEDVADRVLLRLIPYRDSPGYREKGAWIHIAPATGDPRARTKAAMPEDWEKSAEAILRLVRRCEEHLDQLAEACREFSESPYSKGIQAGLITPILNAVRPEEFLLANGKSVTAINHFSGSSFGPKLVDYPELNSTGHAFIAEVAGDMRGHLTLPQTEITKEVVRWPGCCCSARPPALGAAARSVTSKSSGAVQGGQHGARPRRGEGDRAQDGADGRTCDQDREQLDRGLR